MKTRYGLQPSSSLSRVRAGAVSGSRRAKQWAAGHRPMTLPSAKVMYPQQSLRTDGSPEDGGGTSPPTLDSEPCPQGEVNAGHQGLGDGNARQEEMPASYQPGQGGEGSRQAQGSPFLCGRELMMLAAGCQGRKTNQCSIFKFSCGHYPRSQERGRGGGERRKQLRGRLLGGGWGWMED